MSPLSSRCRKDYHPVLDKSATNVLVRMFVEDFGFSDKRAIAELMVERILAKLGDILKPVSVVKPGQMVMLVADVKAKKHTYASVKETSLVPVVLNLVADEDIRALEAGEKMRLVQTKRIVRILNEAYAQGGVAALSDVAVAVGLSLQRVSEFVQEYSKSNNVVLPYRGTIHDLGPSISHKVMIIRMFKSGMVETEIARKSHHSIGSVTNYIRAYKNVVELQTHGFSASDIGRILRMSVALVEKYQEIASESRQDTVNAESVETGGENPPSGKLLPAPTTGSLA